MMPFGRPASHSRGPKLVRLKARARTHKFRAVGRRPLWCAFRTQVGHRVRSEEGRKLTLWQSIKLWRTLGKPSGRSGNNPAQVAGAACTVAGGYREFGYRPAQKS
jgi:hypothetical protein